MLNEMQDAAQRPKRKQVKNACVNCQKACKKCDDGRPCGRCIKLGITATCTNSPRKERKKGMKRGPYKKRLHSRQVSPATNDFSDDGDVSLHLPLSTPFTESTAQVFPWDPSVWMCDNGASMTSLMPQPDMFSHVQCDDFQPKYNDSLPFPPEPLASPPVMVLAQQLRQLQEPFYTPPSEHAYPVYDTHHVEHVQHVQSFSPIQQQASYSSQESILTGIPTFTEDQQSNIVGSWRAFLSAA